MSKGFSLVTVLVVATVSVPAANAALITSPLDPALAGATVIDFDSEATQNFVAKTLSGVTFTAASGFQLRIADAGEGGTYGGTLQELSTLNSNVGFEIAFGTPVSAFGMNWGGANENWTVTLFDSAHVLIETLTFLGGDPGKGATYIEFYGAQANDIRYVSLVAQAPDWVKVDDFRFVPQAPGPAPEPSTLALLTLALGVAGGRWRRSRWALTWRAGRR